MNEPSFYWFDYETFGTHAAWDRPCQFAGIRTNAALEPISEPMVLFCRQSPDYLPQPEACKVTGLTPQLVSKTGLSEADFIAQIHRQMTVPNTCSVGYNNVRFDDEFTRHTLFRNLMDPYEQEWKNHCSRWDLLDVVRLTRALRPEGIHWPVNNDGTSSNRLEHLTAANHIEHSQAHDAMSDVWATLSVARLIKTKNPKLFEYLFKHRGKNAVSQLLNTRDKQPRLQVSGMIPGSKQHISPVLPIASHPQNRNSIIVLDLSEDEQYLTNLSAEEIQQRLFMKLEEREKTGVQRPGIRTIQTNKCPVVVPVNTLRAEDSERLGLFPKAIKERTAAVLSWLDEATLKRIQHALERDYDKATTPDVDGTLYSGSFLTDADKSRLAAVRQHPAAAATQQGLFDDRRLDELVFRYQARNYPDTLNDDEMAKWKQFCAERLNAIAQPWLDLNEFRRLLDDDSWHENQELRESLREYATTVEKFYR